MVIFTISFYLLECLEIRQFLLEEAKFFAFITFFITWVCPDYIRKSEGEDDTNQKVSKTSSAKKSGVNLPLCSLQSLGLSRSCPTLQLPCPGQCFHAPWQKCLPPFTIPPVLWCLWKAGLQTRRKLWCIQTDAQT